MSEIPGSTLESFSSPIEATGFTPDDEVRLHESNLGTPEEGRERARQARAEIAAATDTEPKSHDKIAKIGLQLARFREWETTETQAKDFRLWEAELSPRIAGAAMMGYELTRR